MRMNTEGWSWPGSTEGKPQELLTEQVPYKGSSRGSRAFRAPLQRDRLAVDGQGRGEEKPEADSRAPALKRKERP
jgi:hypothetical protein